MTQCYCQVWTFFSSSQAAKFMLTSFPETSCVCPKRLKQGMLNPAALTEFVTFCNHTCSINSTVIICQTGVKTNEAGFKDHMKDKSMWVSLQRAALNFFTVPALFFITRHFHFVSDLLEFFFWTSELLWLSHLQDWWEMSMRGHKAKRRDLRFVFTGGSVLPIVREAVGSSLRFCMEPLFFRTDHSV